MKHARRKPTPQERTSTMSEELQIGDEIEGPPAICDLCGAGEEDGTITLQREDGFTICAGCIDGLTGLLAQVRDDLKAHPELTQERRLN